MIYDASLKISNPDSVEVKTFKIYFDAYLNADGIWAHISLSVGGARFPVTSWQVPFWVVVIEPFGPFVSLFVTVHISSAIFRATKWDFVVVTGLAAIFANKAIFNATQGFVFSIINGFSKTLDPQSSISPNSRQNPNSGHVFDPTKNRHGVTDNYFYYQTCYPLCLAGLYSVKSLLISVKIPK